MTTGEKKSIPINILRITALVVLAAGVLGSLYFTLHAGHNNKSFLLVFLFAAWDVSPFIAIFAANLRSGRWAANAHVALYILMIVISIGCLVAYSVVSGLEGTRRTGVFLIAPLISWIIIAVVIPIARKLARKGDVV